MTAEEMKAFYHRYIVCCNAHDLGGLSEFVAEEVIDNGRAQGLAQGLAGYRESLGRVVVAFPDYHWQLDHLLAEGDWLAAHLTGSGTHRGEFLGVAASGQTVAAREFAFYRLRDGKIAEIWGAADNLELLRQIGADGAVNPSCRATESQPDC